MLRRVGNYWHVFPFYKQGRKAVWEGFTSTGKRYLDYVPPELIKRRDNQEMTFELINGSIYRIAGADNKDSLVGAGPVGVTLSEYSLIKPSVWEYIEPMLLENGGWARFNLTPRGENHAYDLVEKAREDMARNGKNARWFLSLLTVDDTGIVTPEQIQGLRDDGRSEETIQQEYYCSFKGSIEGAYYAKQMKAADTSHRIGNVPHDPALPVTAWFDLGIDDSTAVWFIQAERGGAFRVIDYYEANGEALSHYSNFLQKKQAEGYALEPLEFPHDAESKSIQTGKSSADIMRGLGWRVNVSKRTPDLLGDIEQTRTMLGKCWFDRDKCKAGIEALKQYRKEYDEDRKIFKPRPLHDWTSHAADAFRYFAVGYKAKVVTQLRVNKVGIV